MVNILNKIMRLALSLFAIAMGLITFILVISPSATGMVVVLGLVSSGLLVFGISTYLQSMCRLLVDREWETTLPIVGLSMIVTGGLILWMI